MGLLPMEADIILPSFDALCVIFVELSKLDQILKKPVGELADLEKWAIFFEYADKPTHRETVNKIIESKEALQMAGDLLIGISQDERERAIAISRKKFQTDYASDMATSEDRGSRERALAIARNMMKRNRPINEIIEDTGLTREEVETLSV